ncbi:two-partner secretion domain-containing protein [Nostoc sp. UHCC 0870]|uniref:two-partner secretion domain-containing protein n=1 Tax=Nostoc sp. UHCC 0870 TaxID=2914041 RepID=UPI001EE0B8C6|nr:S-layer family protein [Nostoc sp. UHCC 0870]UKP00474.1 S-layer family protein [Nostoc sp. UHCC 0870]
MKVVPFLLIFISGLLTPEIMPLAMLGGTPLAMAQVVSDGTTSTIVNPSGNNFNILNGIEKGNNLFHSFSNFSVPTSGSATFDVTNTPNITTIFSRVTGGNISHIDGLVQTLGGNNPVSLFLMNPAGIVFGQNASLNIGGSFVGTTANSIKFADGTEFSAVNPTSKALLTMSIPIGLQMGQHPTPITALSSGHQLKSTNTELVPTNLSANTTGGLRVESRQTLALVGGDIVLTGGMLIAEGGRVELGSVKQSATVNVTAGQPGFAFNYADITNLGSIQLSQQALLDVSGVPAGSIQVQGRQVSLTNGSLLLAQNSGVQAGGRIHVQATESLYMDGYLASQGIRNGLLTETLGKGASQDITINTQQLTIRNGAGIINRTFGFGHGGNIVVQASEFIEVRDFNPANIFSVISSSTLADGNGGNITLFTPRLTVANGAVVGSVTFSRTQGRGGDLLINADRIEIIGNHLPGATALSTASFVSGNAGNAILNTDKLTVRDSGVITSSSSSRGTAGNVTINASAEVSVQGRIPRALSSSEIRSAVIAPSQFAQLFFGIPAIPIGQGGNVTINTPLLTVSDQGSITVRNQGIGDAGNIQVNTQSLRLSNNGSITATTESGAGGDINLQTELLSMRYGSTITTKASGMGNGGNINITAPVILGLENSDIIANAVQGRGGNINITTQGIIGLEYRNTLTPREDLTNDITASSQFNVNGTVQINNIGVDPNSGLLELPANITDQSQQIATGCSNTNDSSFVATGRGGVPQNPTQEVRSDVYDGLRLRTWSDIRDISAFHTTAAVTPQIPPSPEVLVQATSWRRNANGKIELRVAQSPDHVPSYLTCGAAVSQN